MKNVSKAIAVLMLALSLATPTLAAEIPIESYPENATEKSAAIAENLISGILDEVQNGLGYQPAWCKAHNAIYNAVLAKNTNGYGYSDLAAISRNAILQYRDMYLRLDYYAQQETVVKEWIADLITAVASGSMDYTTARKEAYTRIYQAADPGYVPDEGMANRIYLDIPAVDPAQFTIARRLLMEAVQ